MINDADVIVTLAEYKMEAFISKLNGFDFKGIANLKPMSFHKFDTIKAKLRAGRRDLR